MTMVKPIIEKLPWAAKQLTDSSDVKNKTGKKFYIQPNFLYIVARDSIQRFTENIM